MEIQNIQIDHGKAFDWGRTSEDYAKYRDIYPEQFYQKLVERGLCLKGQHCLDLGTGTGVLPRNMARFGADWMGVDLSENQIAEAKRLSAEAGFNIMYHAMPAEQLQCPDNTFDVITACQCFWYFDHEKLMPKLAKMLKPDGRLVILYMAWLPFEDVIAGASEELVLKYNPRWSGCGEKRHPVRIPDNVFLWFELSEHGEYDLDVPFTRESWHGRMRACRGVGASMNEEELAMWEKEHWKLLENIAPQEFTIKHYAAFAILKKA